MREYGKDFHQDKAINRYDLMGDIEYQAAMLHYWNELYQKSEVDVEKAYRKMKFVEAEKIVEYGLNPPGAMKPTVDNVKAAAICCDEYKAAQAKYYDVMEDRAVYRAAAEAMREKGAMLKLAQSLLIGGFFADKLATPDATGLN